MKITISGGVASTIPTFDSIKEELISTADKALYEAKQSGRNKICFAE
jgi:PleD family two-component response regulator